MITLVFCLLVLTRVIDTKYDMFITITFFILEVYEVFFKSKGDKGLYLIKEYYENNGKREKKLS